VFKIYVLHEVFKMSAICGLFGPDILRGAPPSYAVWRKECFAMCLLDLFA